ncbi:MAG: TlpA family protein disulfide reductase [Gammaproteobacteria bacterium]|nr:TlpA family protein disulfide reductase [Gammaproteobacteria bacterium]
MGTSGIARWTLLLILGLLLQACSEPGGARKLQVGQKLPMLDVLDLQGRPVTFAPQPGKLLMINLWATWCAPCRHEMPSLQRLARKLGADRLTLVGLSVDDDEHVAREYLIENGIDFVSLRDPAYVMGGTGGVANGVFGVRVFPSTFFVAADGTLLRVIEGWRDWDSPEILEDVRALLPPRQAPVNNSGRAGGDRALKNATLIGF